MPNPDFGSKEKGAVASSDREVTRYHSNAIRLEKAGLANAFQNRCEPWEEMDPAVTGPTTVNS